MRDQRCVWRPGSFRLACPDVAGRRCPDFPEWSRTKCNRQRFFRYHADGPTGGNQQVTAQSCRRFEFAPPNEYARCFRTCSVSWPPSTPDSMEFQRQREKKNRGSGGLPAWPITSLAGSRAGGEPRDDLVQVARVGLVNAVAALLNVGRRIGFRFVRGCPRSWERSAATSADNSWSVKVPRRT